MAGLRRLARRGLTFDLLVWPHQLTQAAGIFRALPDLPVVLEHGGLPAGDPSRDQWRAGLRRFAAEVPHAVLKLSALRSVSPAWSADELRPVVREAIECFGPHRCMFGSNFPVDKPAISYPAMWQTYVDLTRELSPSERAAVFRETAARIYRVIL